jgi:hypothetical protein
MARGGILALLCAVCTVCTVAAEGRVLVPSEPMDFVGTSIVVGKGGVRETVGICLDYDPGSNVSPWSVQHSAVVGTLHPDTMRLSSCVRDTLVTTMMPNDITDLLEGLRNPVIFKSVDPSQLEALCREHLMVVIDTPILSNAAYGWMDALTFSTVSVTFRSSGVPSRHTSLLTNSGRYR